MPPAAKSRDAKNREVIAAAKRALQRALDAHATIAAATYDLMNPAKPDIIERAWNDFLVYSSSVFEKLKYGKRTIDEAWFKEVEQSHLRDELLTYLRYARNTVEHGLDRGIHRHEPNISFLSTTLNGPPFGTVFDAGFVRLVPIITEERGKSLTIPLPTTHLGQPVNILAPKQAADLAIKHYIEIVAQAEGYVARLTP